jgi:ferric-dicitrate binding protein FerR (iron transport regulator)
MGSKNLTDKQLRQLAKRFIAGTATAEESALLHEWYNSVDPDQTEVVQVDSPTSSQEIGQEIFASLQAKIEQERARVVDIPRRSFAWKYAAAAILVLIAGISVYLNLKVKTIDEQLATTNLTVTEVVAPQTTRAVITRADGSRLYLDSLSDGTIAMEGNARVIKNADGVVYEAMPDTKTIHYNVLTVPRGSQVVHLTLSDGTRIWLNAESSMRYPVSFTGATRNVEITGEAYFEVSKDPQRRFYVSSRGLTTEVLGTHFNVNTYADEPTMKVTLLEGSVHIKYARGGDAMLQPGEQASAGATSPLLVEKGIDTLAVIAWKNENFMMKGTDLGALARQMARWYDIQVVFEGKVPDRKFGGSISRNVNLSTMLKALEESGIESQFEEGKVIIK